MRKLTTKQEKFVQAWLATGNKSEAYRQAYNAKNSNEATIKNKAHKLSNRDNVRATFEKLAAQAQERNDTTIDHLDQMFKEIYDMGKDAGKLSAMVSATMGLMKLYGLDAETTARLKAGTIRNELPSPEEYAKRIADALPD